MHTQRFRQGTSACIGKAQGYGTVGCLGSSVTRMEVEYGLQLNLQRGAKIGPVMEALLSKMTTLPFGDAEAKAAGALRAALRKRGTPIGTYDVLIAATALVHGLILSTSNDGEFLRVGGLNVENWRE